MREIKYLEENIELKNESDYEGQLKSQNLSQKINKFKNFPTMNEVVGDIEGRLHKYGNI